jgi:hypothetical protein
MKVLTTQARGGVESEMALGDLDGDGYLDMVSGSEPQQVFQYSPAASASSFLGKGDGTFVTKASFPVGSPPDTSNSYSAVGDLNRDGVLDLVTTSPAPNSITVRLGAGDGTFSTGTDYAMGAGPAGIVIADLNADGNLDIATAAQKDNAVSLRFGMGDGTFGERVVLPLVGSPRFLASVDWNQDGILDLLATDDYLHVLLGVGGGSFAKALDCGIAITHYSKGGSSQPAAPAADFNQDGVLDLAVGSGVLFGMNGCNFVSRFDYPNWWPLVADDFDGDGRPDLVAATEQGLALFAANGAAGFDAPVNLGNLGGDTAVSGDLNGDGRLDMVLSGGSVRVLLNTCP